MTTEERMRTAWRWAFATTGAIALALAALPAPVADAQATTRLRVLHMSPDAPAVDVLVDGQRAISNLAFKAATDYAAIPSGQRNARVTPAGQNQTAVIDANPDLPAGQDLTVVAVGRVAQIEALTLQDDNRAPSAGKAKVRFVHASPDAPAVDIAVAGGPVLFPNVQFKGVAGYNEVDAGTYNLEVRAAGTQDVALRVPNVALQPGQIVTIFAAGLAADGSLSAVPVVYSAAGTGGQTPASMPRTGTGGGMTADTESSGGLVLGLVAAAVVAGGLGALALARRRHRAV
jgi:hypothetical protein